MLTRLFDFWKVKLWLELDGHVEVTNPNESIDTVYPADKTSFVPRCPKLYSLIVGDMVTLAQGAQPIFSPHISVTIALSMLSLIMATLTSAPGAPCSRVACLSAREELRAGWAGDDDSSKARWPQQPHTRHWSPVNICRIHHFSHFFQKCSSFIKSLRLKVTFILYFYPCLNIRGSEIHVDL